MAKKTIMLVCSAGMSTSLLVTKMQKAAEAKGMEQISLLFQLQKPTNIWSRNQSMFYY